MREGGGWGWATGGGGAGESAGRSRLHGEQSFGGGQGQRHLILSNILRRSPLRLARQREVELRSDQHRQEGAETLARGRLQGGGLGGGGVLLLLRSVVREGRGVARRRRFLTRGHGDSFTAKGGRSLALPPRSSTAKGGRSWAPCAAATAARRRSHGRKMRTVNSREANALRRARFARPQRARAQRC